MRERFPIYSVVDHEWTNVADRNGSPMLARLQELLTTFFGDGEVIVEVHRRVGAVLPLEAAAQFVGEHHFEGVIKVADRGFTAYVVVLAKESLNNTTPARAGCV